MRSSRDCLAAIACVALLAACGTELEVEPMPMPEENEPIEIEPDACETSYLDYNNFGAPFVINWCRGCHSSSIPAGMRQKAPAAVNFDTAEDVRTWGDRIRARAASMTPTMPPAGGPTAEERALLAEWVACGAR